MSEITKSLRYRVNVSQTSTGKKSWDCTVEAEAPPTGADNVLMGIQIATTEYPSLEMQVLALSDRLVKQLETRYPMEVKGETK